ncbi:MAG: hypothetical protein K5872_07490 [Rhizobiaceae bacterium]|nr:hypothetical protein [Rhizobiaceae bacterium]MCV0406056.1 hypothetical protein [Rhizobiaceae bacterium]
MPRYRFEFMEDLGDETVEGIELQNDEEAHKEAVRCAREIMADGVMEGVDRTGWLSRVFDEATGRLVATVRFSDLLTKRPG